VKHHSTASHGNPSRRRSDFALESFDGPCMTSFGGAGLWRRFLDKLNIGRQLAELCVPGTGRRFTTGQYLLAIVCGLLLGLQRQADVAGLRQDPAALKALGLQAVPSQPSLSRFLSACPRRLGRQILDISRGFTRQLRSNFGSATIDLDGQVQVVRGDAQGADFGYNPKRRGSKSYFVLLGVLAECRDILDAWILPGSRATVSARVARLAYRRSRRGLHSRTKRVRLRADAAFYRHEFLSLLERDKVTYFIAACLQPKLKRLLPNLIYCELGGRWAISQLAYEGHGWGRERRMVVIRERLEPEGNRDKQLQLFKCDGYAYQVIVTNADWKPEEVWHFYNHRARIENVIKESACDFGLDHIVSRKWSGNMTWLALVVLAYNITNWFREKVLGQHAHRQTAQTLRRILVELPGRLLSQGRQWWLKLWRDHPSRQEYERALERLDAFAL